MATKRPSSAKKSSSSSVSQKAQPKRQSKPKNTNQPKSPAALHAAQILGDIVWLMILLVTIYATLALVSFSMSDPSWSRSIDATSTPHNLAGLAGAYVSDIAYYALGLSVWWLIVAAIVWLYHNFRPVKQHQDKPYHIALGIAGVVLLLFGGSLLEAAVFHQELQNALPLGAGGLVGQSLGGWIERILGVSGSLLVLVVVTIAGLSLLLQISWLELLEQSGAKIEWLWYRLIRRPHKFIKEIPNAKFTRRMVRNAQTITKEEITPVVGAASNRKNLKVKINQAEEVPAASLQRDLFRPASKEQEAYQLPDINLLQQNQETQPEISPDELQVMAEQIEAKLAEYGIQVEVVSATSGPVLTRFEIIPAQGVKGSQITSLAQDLARSLSLQSVRIVETISGKNTMGIEIPNRSRKKVYLRDVLTSKVFQESDSKLTIALGKDIAGAPVVADLAKMPHILVAGMTRSGKSVGVNAMLLSMLYRATPDDVRLIMIDPKAVELMPYADIPHLLCPVVTDMREAGQALNWCVAEMEKRYRLLSHAGVRNFESYNEKVVAAKDAGEPLLNPFSLNPDAPEPLDKLPYIVLLVDEFADLILTERKTVETQINRLAAKARAAGMHMIIATQRPSVDVITGLIKANIPTRLAFTVSAAIDSRTIIDQKGAENLLNYGDSLFLQPGSAEPVRLQSPFASDHEIEQVVAHIKRQQEVEYVDGLLSGEAAADTINVVNPNANSDELFDQAVAFVLESRKTSISSLQRHLRIGYNRAANLMQALEDAGVLSPADLGGARKILAQKDHL